MGNATVRRVTASKVAPYHIGRQIMAGGRTGGLSDYRRGLRYVTLYVGGQVVRVRRSAGVVFA